MNVAQILEELRDAIASPEMTWKPGEGIPEHPEAKHFVGSHHGWTVNVVAYGETVDGGAYNLRRCMAVHLTPELASKALQAARGAYAKND